MSKVFEFNSSLGSLKDKKTGSILTNTNVTIKKTEKGRSAYFNGTNSKLLCACPFDLNTDWSFSATVRAFDLTNLTWDGIITIGDNTSQYTIGLSFALSRVLLRSVEGTAQAGSYTNAINDNNFHLFVATHNVSTKTITFYLDNKTNGSFTYIETLRSTTHITLGFQATSTGYLGGNITNAKLYDEIIDTNEMQKLFNDFNNKDRNKQIIVRNFRQNSYRIPNPNSDSNLKLYHDYKLYKGGDTIIDETNNNNDGTIIGSIEPVDNGIKFPNAVNNYIDDGNDSSLSLGTNDGAIEFIINFNSLTNNDMIIRCGAGSTTQHGYQVIISSNLLRLFFSDGNPRLFGDLNDYSLLNDKNYHVIINFDRDGNAYSIVNGVQQTSILDISTQQGSITNGTNYTVGGTNTFKLDAVLKFFRVYNRLISLSEAKYKYNKIARDLNLYINGTNWDATGETLTSGNIGNSNEIEIQSGSWKVGEESGSGEKYIENVSAGIISTNSDSAYGTWEFDAYKQDTSNVTIPFISTNKLGGNSFSGYCIRLVSDESIAFIESDGVVPSIKFQTTSSYINNNTWYTFKIERTLDGEFTVYIKSDEDSNFKSWTLINVSGGSGTNPVTDTTYQTSKYFVADLDSGDRIKNIKIFEGVIQ